MRTDKIAHAGVAISDALDEAGLTPDEQIAALGGMLSLAFAALPEEKRNLHIDAHIAGLEEVRGFNKLVRQ